MATFNNHTDSNFINEHTMEIEKFYYYCYKELNLFSNGLKDLNALCPHDGYKNLSIPCAIMHLYNVFLLVQIVDMAQSTLKPMSSRGSFW
jgi:hypothetical protein